MKNFSSLSGRIEDLKNRIPDIDTLPERDPDAIYTDCPYCDGYGHIIDENGARPCECVKQETVRTGIEYARIPKHFENATLESFDAYTPTLKACHYSAKKFNENYSLDNTKGLYISGGTGAGKTHLAIGIGKALIEKGHDCVFYNTVDLLDEIRSTYDPNNNANPKNRLERDMQRQIFILDDFGVQKTSPWVADRLYALINRRYQDCKTLIVTSNHNLRDLAMKFDERLFSRLTQMTITIELKNASDYRNKNTRFQS